MTEFLIYSVIVASIAAALFMLFLWKELNVSEKYFGYLVFTTAFFEIIARISVYIGNATNNLPGLHLYTLIKFILISLFFSSLLPSIKKRKNFIPLVLLGSILIIINSIFIQSIYEFNSFSKTGVDLYCVVLSILYFESILKSKYDLQVDKTVLYFVIALFINSSNTSILYLFSNEIMEMIDPLRNKLWLIVLGVNLVTQIIIILGIVQIFKNRKTENLN